MDLSMNMIRNMLLMVLLCTSYIIPHQPTLLFIEGNIGVGKTTFLQVLSQHFPQAVVVYEPCNEWQDISGHNLLDAFYKDGTRWACTMQLYVLTTIMRKFQQSLELERDLYFMERSWFSARYCFATNAFLISMMNQMEWYLYCDVWDWVIKQNCKPTGIIYLQAAPEVCHERMKQRARSEEAIVPLAYLQLLHDRHEEWLVHNKHSMFDVPVLILDASCNFRDDKAVQQRFMSQILDFLQNQENTIFTM